MEGTACESALGDEERFCGQRTRQERPHESTETTQGQWAGILATLGVMS